MAKGHLYHQWHLGGFLRGGLRGVNTELYLVQAYRGTTATGKAYEIITTLFGFRSEFARRLTATPECPSAAERCGSRRC